MNLGPVSLFFGPYQLGMHDIGFFAHIRYADILQLIWPIINIDIYVYFFPTPNCRDRHISSEVNLQTVLLCRLLLCWHKIQSLNLCNIYSLCKRGKILELTLCKTCHIIAFKQSE